MEDIFRQSYFFNYENAIQTVYTYIDTVCDKDEGSPYYLDPHSWILKVLSTHASAGMVAEIHVTQILSKPRMTLRVV